MTKKQHYYPRCLLKYFADEYDEVNVYIRQANKLSKVNYERLCFSDYSYESDDTIDNILEISLAIMKQKWEQS